MHVSQSVDYIVSSHLGLIRYLTLIVQTNATGMSMGQQVTQAAPCQEVSSSPEEDDEQKQGEYEHSTARAHSNDDDGCRGQLACGHA